jgi:hypothetical protein
MKARGSLLIWLDKDMCWHHSPNGKRGRRPKYSEAAIQFCLAVKACSIWHCVRRWVRRKACSSWLAWTTLEIRAIEVTDNAAGDAPMLPCLLDQIGIDETIASVSGDGA